MQRFRKALVFFILNIVNFGQSTRQLPQWKEKYQSKQLINQQAVKQLQKIQKTIQVPTQMELEPKSVWRLKSLSSASAEAIPKTTAENISKIIEIVKGIAMS